MQSLSVPCGMNTHVDYEIIKLQAGLPTLEKEFRTSDEWSLATETVETQQEKEITEGGASESRCCLMSN